jgi:hypothetical protein
MILGSVVLGFSMAMAARPEALKFIGEPPNSFLLFGSFLLPYSLLRPKYIYLPFFLLLVVASVILVNSAVKIRTHYAELEMPSGDLAVFLIGLSLVTCALQPFAVIAARLCRSAV